MRKNKEKRKMEASVKSFVTAIAVIFVMMVLTYVLTFMIPGGYIPFWKWILSPILVLFTEDAGSLIAIIALLGLFSLAVALLLFRSGKRGSGKLGIHRSCQIEGVVGGSGFRKICKKGWTDACSIPQQ